MFLSFRILLLSSYGPRPCCILLVNAKSLHSRTLIFISITLRFLSVFNFSMYAGNCTNEEGIIRVFSCLFSILNVFLFSVCDLYVGCWCKDWHYFCCFYQQGQKNNKNLYTDWQEQVVDPFHLFIEISFLSFFLQGSKRRFCICWNWITQLYNSF